MLSAREIGLSPTTFRSDASTCLTPAESFVEVSAWGRGLTLRLPLPPPLLPTLLYDGEPAFLWDEEGDEPMLFRADKHDEDDESCFRADSKGETGDWSRNPARPPTLFRADMHDEDGESSFLADCKGEDDD